MTIEEGSYIVEGETKNLLEENWDFLLILDACRYDFFEDIYRDYLDGTLKKAISPATSTTRWLNKVFKDYYEDIIYISANPMVNSKVEVEIEGGIRFDAKKHFFKIIDVWKFGWDNQLGTVPPNCVTDALRNIKDNYKDKRFILHYVQPHEPYIGKKYKEFIPKDYIRARETNRIKNLNQKNLKLDFRAVIQKIILKTLGIAALWWVKKLLDIPSQPSSIYSKEGWGGLKNAYKENLEVGLESVAELLENVSGNILITADHGEYLGEYGRFGHGLVPRRPPIVEVPWLIIEKGKSKRKEVSDKEIIKDRIKMLKRTGDI